MLEFKNVGKMEVYSRQPYYMECSLCHTFVTGPTPNQVVENATKMGYQKIGIIPNRIILCKRCASVWCDIEKLK